ncbi:MAG: Clp protease N-terminal domain-containing protein [Pseudomonadota bacterium]
MLHAFAELLQTAGPNPTLAATIHRAQAYAREQSHRRVTLEHLLLALTEDGDASLVLTACNIDFMRLKHDVGGYLGRLDDRLGPSDSQEPDAHDDLIRIFRVAAAAATQRNRSPNGGLVLAAIVGDGRSPAASMLRSQGLTFDEAVRALQEANANLRASGQPPAAGTQPPGGGQPGQPSQPASSPRMPLRETISAANSAPQPTQPRQSMPASGQQRLPAANPHATEQILADARRKVDAARAVAPRIGHPPPSQAAPQGTSKDGLARLTRPATSEVTAPAPGQRSQPASGLPAAQPTRAPVAPRIGGPVGGPQAPAAPVAPSPSTNPAPPQQRPDPRRTAPSSRGGPNNGRPPVPGPTTQPPGARQAQPQPQQPRPAPRGPGVASAPGMAPPQQQAAAPSSRPPENGKLTAAVPRRMRAMVSETVEVRIARHEIEAITGESLRGDGGDGVIARAMTIRLRAPQGGLYVESVAPETQWIENRVGLLADEFAIWRWTVTPKSKGKQQLQLSMALRTLTRDGHAAETPLPNERIDVRVAGNINARLLRLFGWSIAAGIGAACVYFGPDLMRIGFDLAGL